MVALDYLARDVERLDAVGIDSALCEPLCAGLLLSLSVEHLNEVATDNLALLLRVGNASKVGEELLACVYADNVQAQALVVFHNVAELVLAEHTVVDEDTCEVAADSLVEEHGCYA